MKPIVITSGYMDPITDAHVRYLEAASKIGKVYHILNSDEQAVRKKGRPFMPEEQRYHIIKSLSCVDTAFISISKDNTVVADIKWIRELYPDVPMFFAKGGDDRANKEQVPEYAVCEELGIKVMFGVGGFTKDNSSSKLLRDWSVRERCERPWGYWEVIESYPGTKVKRLVVEPGRSLSNQMHLHREEHWFVVQGSGKLKLGRTTVNLDSKVDTYAFIPTMAWHQLINDGEESLVLLEVQQGTICVEEDIERR